MQSDPRPLRGWALVLPVLITILVGAGLGGFVVLENQREADRIEAADDIGSNYLNDVATFRIGVVKALGAAKQDDPADLRRALTAAIAEPPVLPEVKGKAQTSSSTYAEAQRVADDLLAPYKKLSKALKKAEKDKVFVKAARKALKLRPTDYVDGVLLESSDQVRGRLIPAFVNARDVFSQVPVPEGATEAANLTTAALQEVIDKATTLADRIDDNRSYTFTYGDAAQAALTAVENYATQANGDVAEALNTIRDLN